MNTRSLNRFYCRGTIESKRIRRLEYLFLYDLLHVFVKNCKILKGVKMLQKALYYIEYKL